MDFELKHLGQTLVVGGLGVYATLFLVRVFRSSNASFFTSNDQKLQFQEAAVYLTLIFSSGILLEDVSKNFVADRPDWPWLRGAFQKLLDSDKNLRFSTMFDEKW